MKNKKLWIASLVVLLPTLFFIIRKDRTTLEEQELVGQEILETTDVSRRVPVKGKKLVEIDAKKIKNLKIRKFAGPSNRVKGQMLKGDALRKFLKDPSKKSKGRELASNDNKQILSLGKRKYVLKDNYFAVRKEKFSEGLGKKIRDFANYTIFSTETSNDLSEDASKYQTVVQDSINGTFAIFTGGLIITYVDYTLKDAIEDTYDLKLVTEFSHLSIASYQEENYQVLMEKYEALKKENNIKEVHPELIENEVVF